MRLLGVPTVRDRVVHAILKALLEPIFEPLFSEHSYGFRPRRNQRQAVKVASRMWWISIYRNFSTESIILKKSVDRSILITGI
jgi:RNA-directed DNA polymerase